MQKFGSLERFRVDAHISRKAGEPGSERKQRKIPPQELSFSADLCHIEPRTTVPPLSGLHHSCCEDSGHPSSEWIRAYTLQLVV